ncbi:MAG: hypothetical protein AAB472_00815 [Patescibacteria group bacterium]
MDPTIVASAPATQGGVHFLNIEYLFYQLYLLFHGGGGVVGVSQQGFTVASLAPLFTTLWIIITIVAYLFCVGFFALFLYSRTRIHQVESEEALRYTTFTDVHAAELETEHHRWNHIRTLIESTSSNDWRQAILEADIILDDMLTSLGYPGASVGEKLKVVDPAKFRTLQEAWEAHKVRNEIAHQGSEYPLTDHIAYRTILHYENVFREHGEI